MDAAVQVVRWSQPIKRHLVIFNLIFALGVTPFYGRTQSRIIFFHKPYSAIVEMNLYTKVLTKFDYKTQYENLRAVNVSNEVANAIKHGDFRFVAISGNSYPIPGLMGYYKDKNGIKGYGVLKKYRKYFDKNQFKVILGTSDMIDGSLPPLQSAAADFARAYNELLIKQHTF